ncbi:hypothetical protein [Sphingomonas sp. SUN039]|uniref:hypothetical protein n=1 Tax=Sphingomonas sp. SUN039 TaxID=2937787 RepID=UPI0021645AF1|nr:hypothetical protein [Sphingomonas sp. SUN039]UVO54942.1 hypothetical protein M0209_12705 [Sphingomonas sp. SUN039]
MTATARRNQTAITIRSARAAERLALLTRDGRSQASVVEEALDRMPLPAVADRARIREEIRLLLARVPKGTYPTMQEIDAEMYDENGMPR